MEVIELPILALPELDHEDDEVLVILVNGPHDGEEHYVPARCPCGGDTFDYLLSCCGSVYNIVAHRRRGYFVDAYFVDDFTV